MKSKHKHSDVDVADEPASARLQDEPGAEQPEEPSAEGPSSVEGQSPAAADIQASGERDESPDSEPQDKDSAPVNESDEAEDEGAKPKRSAAEVIAELRDSVEMMRSQFNSAEQLIAVCKKKLVKEADEYRLEGMKPLLESLMLLHDLVFRHAQAMEAGDVAPDGFVLNLLRTMEAEMASHQITVVRPHPGDEPDLTVMKLIGTAQCPFWRKADRIARVHSCGFALRMEGTMLILRKAEVTVYRKEK